MTEPEQRRRHHRTSLWLTLGLALMLVAAGFAALGLTGRTLPIPGWIVGRIEARANAALVALGSVRIAEASFVVDDRFVPHVRFDDVAFLTPGGEELGRLPQIEATLAPQPLLRGKVIPRSLRVRGAQVTLNRDADGALDLDLGGAGAGALDTSPKEVFDAIDAAFALPQLSVLTEVETEGIEIRLNDARSGQVWLLSDGRVTLTQTETDLALNVGFDLAEKDRFPASALLSIQREKGADGARFGAVVSGVSAVDLAAQSPALAWLGVLDAPISGSFRAAIDSAGAFTAMDGTLEIGQGALQPAPDVVPVPFDYAKLYLSYDPSDHQLSFAEVSLDSPSLRVKAAGKAWLKGMESGFPEALIGQMTISDLRADPEGLFETPVRFTQGALDLKLTLDPFEVQFGQFVLVDGDQRISARGRAAARPDGWDMAFDTHVNEITIDRMLALWPVGLVPKTRAWLAENVTTAELFDVTAAVRLRPDVEPRLSLGYEFRGAEVRFLRTLPPIEDGAGYSTIEGNSYTLVVDRGRITAPSGGLIDVTGSVLQVPDIRVKPALAEIDLKTDSTIPAALSLLDQPPFNFLTKAGRPTDIAEGRARIDADLRLPLVKKVGFDAVSYSVRGVLSDVRSDRIAPGRVLQSDRLELRADPEGMEISGPGTVSGVPFDATWRQAFGPDTGGRSRVEGTVELSPRFLEAFSIALPQGAVTGQGAAELTLDLVRDGDVAFRLQSDLNRVALSLPEIGWSKPAGGTGRLVVSGTLGTPPRIDALALDAPGLSLSGTVALEPDGALEAAQFAQVKLGDWFTGPLVLRGRGKGRPVGVEVAGGVADMRRATLGQGGGSGGGGGPISIALDELRISAGIALSNLRGTFSTQGGFSGNFTAGVNGRGLVAGTVAPMGGRSAFRVKSDDAGDALDAAGIFTRARGGSLDMTLRPDGPPGQYRGTVDIRQVRVRDAPVMAELLGAISVIGLLEQLNGDGLLFSQAEGEFRLTPQALEVTRGAATGASLGVSIAGLYGLETKRIEMQGVVSPIYLVNGVGQIVSRRGEGLFGFNYRLSGTSDNPRVSVNPLSILTPGMFREIFRRPALRIAD